VQTGSQLGGKSLRDGTGDLLLERQDVGDGAIVSLGPEVPPTGHIDELDSNSQPLAGLADAALHDPGDAKDATDFGDVPRLALELERRRPTRHVQRGNNRQR